MADSLDDLGFNDSQKGYVADLEKQYSNAEAQRLRTAARYGLPAVANAAHNWAINRSLALANKVNSGRKASRGSGTSGGSSSGGSSGGGGSNGRNTGTGNSGNGNTGTSAGRTASTGNPAQSRTTAGGWMQLLPLLLGRDGTNDLQRQGLIKYLQTAYREFSNGAPATQDSLDMFAKSVQVDSQGNVTVWRPDGTGTVMGTDGIPKEITQEQAQWSAFFDNNQPATQSNLYEPAGQYDFGGFEQFNTDQPQDNELASWFGDGRLYATDTAANTDVGDIEWGDFFG